MFSNKKNSDRNTKNKHINGWRGKAQKAGEKFVKKDIVFLRKNSVPSKTPLKQVF